MAASTYCTYMYNIVLHLIILFNNLYIATSMSYNNIIMSIPLIKKRGGSQVSGME